YTETGGRIAVEGRRDGTDAVLALRDSGIGIAPDMLKRVFDLFAQAGRGLHRTPGGLGVRLTIAQRVVGLHGGRGEARSRGGGRCAGWVLRLAVLAGVPGARAVSPASAGDTIRQRILVVEDNIDTAETLAMLLEVLGHEVHVAHDGPAALELARAKTPRVLF